jgi:hypothetical protein
MRHEPKASRVSVEHNLGIGIPASAAARMIEVPAGALTVSPFI